MLWLLIPEKVSGMRDALFVRAKYAVVAPAPVTVTV